MRGRQLVPAMGLGILLAACSGPASESSLSPTTSRSVAPADLVAVAKRTFPLIPQFGYYAVCGSDGNTSRCPYTARLKARLAQPGITLCPCPNPEFSMDVTATPSQTGGVAHVVLGSGPQAIKVDLVIIQTGGKLLVDDELCTGGGPSTSIYVRGGYCVPAVE
ncbi:MAG: hypothetical protein E6J01_01205 [Chloroflexi bacterium]|nr:MAG: hypothetical protein E6J01_01205 [Chloroflexota bacterium]